MGRLDYPRAVQVVWVEIREPGRKDGASASLDVSAAQGWGRRSSGRHWDHVRRRGGGTVILTTADVKSYVLVKRIFKQRPSREDKKQRAASSISLENGAKIDSVLKYENIYR